MTFNALHLIGGKWIDSAETRSVTNPADDSEVGTFAYGDGALAREAVEQAAASFADWAAMPARRRSVILLRAADLIAERATRIGRLLAMEGGKRLSEAIGEVSFSAEYFRWFAEEARRPSGSVHPPEAVGRRHLSIQRPAGVVASLTPWNFPCSIQARKLAPALASGCTVVARVSEKAPLAVTQLIGCLVDAGIPPGTINLVHGPASTITNAYVSHPAVRVVTFTGSTAVGQQVMKSAADRVVRPLLELGGDAPFVVFEDADIEKAVEGAMLAKFRNNGQSCIAANRLYVHRSVFDDFVTRLARQIDGMVIGDPLAENSPDLGPCIDLSRVEAVRDLVDDAIAGGARKVTRDFQLPPRGSFAAPALLTDVPTTCGLATSEVFGPVAAVFPFDSEDEVLRRANDTELGLAGYFYTTDQARVWRVAELLDVGIVGVNDPLPTVCFAPMGGTKQSGLGREGGSHGLEEFQETRYLAIGA
jgi:succinate-semialdehyde dehydrogenase / glutarate-semialdehyde dehydrogenase